MAGAIFIPSAFLHFSLTLIEQRRKYLKTIVFWYILSLIFLILDFTPLFVKDVRPRLIFSYWPTAGITFTPFLAMFLGVTIYAHVLMFKSYGKISGIRRNQIKYVFLGTAIGFLGGLTNYPLWYDIPMPPIGNALVAVYVFLVAYAIIKYRLMDINIAITRAGIFGIVYALVLGIPFWFGIKTSLWQYSTIIMTVLATSGPFIYNYLRHRAEERILREQRKYQGVLRELSKTMSRIRDLNKLLKAVVSTIVDTVKVSFAGVYLKEDKYKAYQLKHYYPTTSQTKFPESIPLESNLARVLFHQKRPLLSDEIGQSDNISLDTGLAIPCFMEDDLLGFMILGSKPRREMYTPDDLVVFETLSYSMGLAIENCRFWKEIEDRHRKARLQEMDTYSYSLAHEIDNPMQIILGQTVLLQKYLVKDLNLPQEKQKDIEESFDSILEASRRVSKMVSAIRDFGQPTTGEMKPLRIEEVVDSFSQLYLPQFKTNRVIFSREITAKLGFIRGEKPELMQVLVILANNSLDAMKYAKTKKITLKIESSQGHIRTILSDTGSGIKKQDLPIIFSPFVTTKASSVGTGMGLYNAKKIIKRHKGKIWAESEGQDKGASFIIELPIAKDISEEEFKKQDKGKMIF